MKNYPNNSPKTLLLTLVVVLTARCAPAACSDAAPPPSSHEKAQDLTLIETQLSALLDQPEKANALIMTQMPDDRWILFFHFGQLVGKQIKADFPRLKTLGESIAANYRWDFFDGVGDGVPWADLHQPARELIASVNKSFSDEKLRSLLRIGVLLRFVMKYKGAPEQVKPVLDSVPEVSLHEKSAALSVGLMRHYKHQPLDAIPVILSYDANYHEFSFEELGWWIGDNNQENLAEAVKQLSQIPETYRCFAYHGWVRGVETYHRFADQAQAALAIAPPEARHCCCEALGWKASKRYVDNPQEAATELRAINDASCREQALKELERLSAGAPLKQ